MRVLLARVAGRVEQMPRQRGKGRGLGRGGGGEEDGGEWGDAGKRRKRGVDEFLADSSVFPS